MIFLLSFLGALCAIFIAHSLLGSYVRFNQFHKKYLIHYIWFGTALSTIITLNNSEIGGWSFVLTLLPSILFFLRFAFNMIPGGQADRNSQQIVEKVINDHDRGE